MFEPETGSPFKFDLTELYIDSEMEIRGNGPKMTVSDHSESYLTLQSANQISTILEADESQEESKSHSRLAYSVHNGNDGMFIANKKLEIVKEEKRIKSSTNRFSKLFGDKNTID